MASTGCRVRRSTPTARPSQRSANGRRKPAGAGLSHAPRLLPRSGRALVEGSGLPPTAEPPFGRTSVDAEPPATHCEPYSHLVKQSGRVVGGVMLAERPHREGASRPAEELNAPRRGPETDDGE